MPVLDWIGKEKVVNHHLDVPYKVLERIYSFDKTGKHSNDIGSKNMIIHGDNLEALKSLLPQYEGMINCIYIDPPYNTGNEKWVYNDNVNDPRIKKWLGEVVGTEEEDLSRHDKWLCMMYPRLKLLHKLLKDDGVIFISIDDNEQANLKLICNEIFGEKNFVTTIHIELSATQGMKVKAAKDGNIVKNAEYILVYSKDGHNNIAKKILYDFRPEYDDHYSKILGDNLEILSLKDVFLAKYPKIKNENLSIMYQYNREFREFVKANASKIVADDKISGFNIDDYSEIGKVYRVTKGSNNYYIYNNGNKLRQLLVLADSFGQCDDFAQSYGLRKIRGNWWKDFYKDMGNVSKEGNTVFLNGKKPIRLLEQIIKMCTEENAIILDSFAGSGSTAHAVLSLNNKENSNRKFITIELMDYAEDTTAERIKNVIKELNTGDYSFYELGEQLLINNELNENVDIQKIKEYVYFMETKRKFETNAEEESLLGIQNNTAYYFYYDKNSITTLNREFLSTVKTKAERYVMYADLCTLSEAELDKYNITFKKIPRDISKL